MHYDKEIPRLRGAVRANGTAQRGAARRPKQNTNVEITS